MKTIIITTALTVLSLSVVASEAAAQAAAAIPADATVVYVSSQRLSSETTLGKDGLTRIQALQREKTEDLRARQQTLEDTRRALSQATDAAERGRLEVQAQQQQSDFTRAQAQATSDLQGLQREIQAALRPAVQAVLAELLKGTSVEVVLPLETAVVWAAPGRDVTSAVIERLNKTPSPQS
jgi:Skp family chaperone for outer membrane proteins